MCLFIIQGFKVTVHQTTDRDIDYEGKMANAVCWTSASAESFCKYRWRCVLYC